jgi:hypothetical protein
MNEMGRNGWELVGIANLAASAQTLAVFKRPLGSRYPALRCTAEEALHRVRDTGFCVMRPQRRNNSPRHETILRCSSKRPETVPRY